jgi:hypothetical protein
MGEQGFLNLMLFQAADQGRIRIAQAPLQFLVPDFSSDAAQKMFPVDAQTGPIHQERDIIIHWCGVNKPISTTSMVYAQPMTFYRNHFVSISSKSTGKMAGFSLKIEDLFHYVHLYKGKFRRKIAKFNQAIHRKSVRG